jgi:predicted ATP-dependent serine protease
MALIIAIISAIKWISVQSALVILGDISIQGASRACEPWSNRVSSQWRMEHAAL